MASNEAPPGISKGLVGRRGNTRGGRLPSLKGPRDLTLGGVQKKTFVPNIPVKPKEKKETNVKDSLKTGVAPESVDRQGGDRKRGRGRGERGRGERGRGRGRGRGERELIQSHSIFEQGPSAEHFKSRGSWGSSDVDRVPSSKTTSIKKEKKDPEETKRILDELMKDDFIADNLDTGDHSLNPIKLPLGGVKNEVKAEYKDFKLKKELKQEPGVIADEDQRATKNDLPETVADLFTTEKSEAGDLLFIQLPDTLPGEPPEAEHTKDPRIAAAKSSSGDTSAVQEDDALVHPHEELAKRLGLCSLKQFSEGYIGKVQVHQSGKTTLVLGNVHLDMSLGTPSGFLQDVVSIRTEEENDEAKMMVLGHISNKIICVPDFEKMMDT